MDPNNGQPQQPAPQEQPQAPPPAPAAPQPGPVAPGGPVTGGEPLPSGPVSASQMGLDDKKQKIFDLQIDKSDVKNWKKKAVMGGILLVVLLVALIAGGIIAFSEFRTIKYTSSAQMQYKLQFYTKHITRMASGIDSPQLTSLVSKEGKQPITLFITTGEAESFDKIKNCYNYEKLFEVKNDHVGSKLAVCNFLKGTELNGKAGLYLTGFVYEGKAHSITISQDPTGIDKSSPTAAKVSLTKFGLEPYEDDIKKILASIEVLGEK